MNSVNSLALLEPPEVADEESGRPAGVFGMVGQSPAIQKVFKLIEVVADKDVTALVTGETGTGKELVARALHTASRRRQGPFVAMNCAAIPENLLEDELFGHVPGAFTGADSVRVGKFESARGGTIFLDEIGDMPLYLQIKLLRVLETHRLEKLGSNKPVRLDVRVIAATNSKLSDKISRGQFRRDLFYRLNVARIDLPPLRDRREDIPLLVNHFLQEFSRELQGPPKKIEPQLLRQLVEQDWPGNVRELRNYVERAILLAGSAPVLVADVYSSESSLPQPDPRILATPLELPEHGLDLKRVLEELEKRMISQSLERTHGNKRRAARLLSLKRTTLNAKLRRFNLMELDESMAH